MFDVWEITQFGWVSKSLFFVHTQVDSLHIKMCQNSIKSKSKSDKSISEQTYKKKLTLYN